MEVDELLGEIETDKVSALFYSNKSDTMNNSNPDKIPFESKQRTSDSLLFNLRKF